MKKIIIAVVLAFLTSVSASYAAVATGSHASDTQPYTAIVPGTATIAGWVAHFISTYDKYNIYQAVADVFKKGHTPDEITTNALNIKGINPQNLVAALYCAGAKPEDIRVASENAGISEMILIAGFETAKTVCGDAITDTQAYTPVGPNFAGIPGGGGGEGMAYASPSVP